MNIGVFFGGKSPEHDVSIITGQLVIKELQNAGYSVVPIYISKEGKWYTDPKLGKLSFFLNPQYIQSLESFAEYSIDINTQGKIRLTKKGILGKQIDIDVAFPALHGQNGEDGTIQGLFEMTNVPYVGCTIACLAITVDKVFTKQVYQALNIPTVPFITFSEEDWNSNQVKITNQTKKLTWPLIVKPARLGSSIGIAKVETIKDLDFAIEVAFHYDTKVIVEECITDLMDVTCCCLGNKEIQASLLQESVFEKQFLSYEDKYLREGGTQLGSNQKSVVIPADLSNRTTKQIQNMAIEIYKAFDCSGLARIDFLYDKTTKKVYANEINPMPGTLYHHLWKASRIDIKTLLTTLIQAAIEKHQEKDKTTVTFQSDILKFAASMKLQLKG